MGRRGGFLRWRLRLLWRGPLWGSRLSGGRSRRLAQVNPDWLRIAGLGCAGGLEGWGGDGLDVLAWRRDVDSNRSEHPLFAGHLKGEIEIDLFRRCGEEPRHPNDLPILHRRRCCEFRVEEHDRRNVELSSAKHCERFRKPRGVIRNLEIRRAQVAQDRVISCQVCLIERYDRIADHEEKVCAVGCHSGLRRGGRLRIGEEQVRIEPTPLSGRIGALQSSK